MSATIIHINKIISAGRIFLVFCCLWPLGHTAQAVVPDTTLAPPYYGLTGLAKFDIYDPIRILRIRRFLRKGEDMIWDQPDSAALYLDRAIRESDSNHYVNGIVEANISLGKLAMGQGDFNNSFTFYRIAERFLPYAIKREILKGGLYINIGATYFYRVELEQALTYYYLILQHMQRYSADNENIMMAYNNLADLLLRMGQNDQAAYYIQRGEPLARQSKDTALLAYFMTNKGELMSNREKYAEAEACFDEALYYGEISRNNDVKQAVWNSIGKIRMKQNKPLEAIPYLRQALAIGTYPYYASLGSSYTLGQALYQTGQYQEAEHVLTEALLQAEQAGLRQDKLEALTTLASVYEEQGQISKALLQRKRFIALQDSLLSKEKIKAMNAMEVKYRTSEKDRELVSKQLEIATQRRNIDRKNLWLVISTGGLLLTGLLFLALYKSNKQRQAIAILEAMIAGEEKERSRTAQELHDGVGGLLAAIQMKLSMVNTEGISDIAAMTKEAASEIRKTAHNLMPDVIQRYTFAEAVCMYCETLNRASTDLQVDLQIHEPVSAGNKKTELSLYRIIQELLQNILKHAHASHAIVQINQQYNKLTIMIEDNGKGFDITKVSKGLGIHNLHLRVKMLKGTLSIESTPGQGTTVTISIPV